MVIQKALGEGPMMKAVVAPEELEEYFDRLWPILRSITGEGVRRSHDILSEIIPLERIEIPSGTECFDWVVPKEWVVREAYLIDPGGKRILDIAENNLHLVNYSVPFQGVISRRDLDAHLYSRPDLPEAIPYVTSYYEPRWGFCLSHIQRDALPEGDYQVVIDTDLIEGSLTIGEAVLPGETESEVLISTYTCHPSMANNELSGPLVSAFLYRELKSMEKRRFTYRFLFLPETIGSVAYLQLRGDELKKNLLAGYVVTCVGDSGPFNYKKTRHGNHLTDRAALHVLEVDERVDAYKVHDFFPDGGSDERQYCSPGFNLPVGSLMRTMYRDYAEYHTSMDDKNFIDFNAMSDTVGVYAKIMETLEQSEVWDRVDSRCEPQLSKHGLYPSLGTIDREQISAMMWVLNYSDGTREIAEIARLSGLSIDQISNAAQQCAKAGLIVPLGHLGREGKS